MKNAVCLLFAFVALLTNAQAQVSIGPAAGAYITQYSVRYSGVRVPRTGERWPVDIRFGALANLPVSRKFHLQTGLLYTTNSHKYIAPNRPDLVSGFKLNAVELPVIALYNAPPTSRGHFFFGVGSYLAVFTTGKADIALTDIAGISIGNTKYDITIGNPNSFGFRRMGTGAMLNVGYELKGGFSTRLHFQHALTNIYNRHYQSARLVNYNYGITLAYLLPLKKDKKMEVVK